MEGLQKFLMFIYTEWTTILICIGLIIGIIQKIHSFMLKSDAEKVDFAKKQIKEILLKMVTEAELDYEDWKQAGSIKRSQVIKKIFEMYPILLKATSQEALIGWIDNQIDSSLETLSEIIKANEEDAITEGE